MRCCVARCQRNFLFAFLNLIQNCLKGNSAKFVSQPILRTTLCSQVKLLPNEFTDPNCLFLCFEANVNFLLVFLPSIAFLSHSFFYYFLFRFVPFHSSVFSLGVLRHIHFLTFPVSLFVCVFLHFSFLSLFCCACLNATFSCWKQQHKPNYTKLCFSLIIFMKIHTTMECA